MADGRRRRGRRKSEGRRWEAVGKQGGSHDEKDGGEATSWLETSAKALEPAK
jgi:hypothetical protein